MNQSGLPVKEPGHLEPVSVCNTKHEDFSVSKHAVLSPRLSDLRFVVDDGAHKEF